MSLHHLCTVRSMHEWHMLFEAFPDGKHRDRLFPVECRMAHATGFALQGPKLAGATSPNATKFCIRRLRLQKLSPLVAT